VSDIQEMLHEMRTAARHNEGNPRVIPEVVISCGRISGWVGTIEAEMRERDAEIERLQRLLADLTHDCLASDFNEHWDSYKAALAPETKP
jgi:hypothetical protein